MLELPPSPTPRTAHRITQDQCLALSLPADAELFYCSGHLQIQTTAVPGIDAACSGLHHALCPGQSWRVPRALHLQLHALQGTALLQCQLPPVAMDTPVPSPTPRRWLAALRRQLAQICSTLQPK